MSNRSEKNLETQEVLWLIVLRNVWTILWSLTKKQNLLPTTPRLTELHFTYTECAVVSSPVDKLKQRSKCGKNTSVTLADIPEESDVYSANWLSSGCLTVHVKVYTNYTMRTTNITSTQQNLTHCKSHTVQSCEHWKLQIKCKCSKAFKVYIRNVRDGWGKLVNLCVMYVFLFMYYCLHLLSCLVIYYVCY